MDLKDIEEIIERDLPNHRLSKKSIINTGGTMDSIDSQATEKPEASTPDFQTLREKYLREKFFGASDASDNVDAKPHNQSNFESVTDRRDSEDIIVSIKPKESTDLRDDSSQLKTAVISATEKKVIGRQG